MANLLHQLFPHEFEELLNALRRDLRSERELAAGDSEWADRHRINARMVYRLLEVLNPTRKILQEKEYLTPGAPEPYPVVRARDSTGW